MGKKYLSVEAGTYFFVELYQQNREKYQQKISEKNIIHIYA